MTALQNKWIRLWNGYLTVRLCGDYVERFLNMCRTHEIVLWNIKKEEQAYFCNVAASDYLETAPFLKKTGTKAKVLHRYGMPFYLPFMKKRFLFFISLILCLGMLYFVTDYIWAMEFVGNLHISEEELTDFLAEENIYYGMKKKELDCEETEKRLRESFPLVTWTSIYFEGTKLFVEVKENEKKEPVTEEIKGTNLVATESGIITSMITRNGIPKVKIGDSVEPGQILVEGNVPVYDEAQNIIAYQVYNSDADVSIRTQLSYEEQLARSYPVVHYTGEERNSIFLEAFGYYMESPAFGKQYQSCETITQKHQVSLLENLYLPIYYGNVCKKEYQWKYLEYSEDEMKKQLNENFEKFILCLQEKGVQIIEKDVKIKKYNKGMEIHANLSVVKQTGKEEAIPISEADMKE